MIVVAVFGLAVLHAAATKCISGIYYYCYKLILTMFLFDSYILRVVIGFRRRLFVGIGFRNNIRRKLLQQLARFERVRRRFYIAIEQNHSRNDCLIEWNENPSALRWCIELRRRFNARVTPRITYSPLRHFSDVLVLFFYLAF